MAATPPTMLAGYLQQVVVVDTDGHWSYVGELTALAPDTLCLRAVAVFDRRDPRGDYELFLIEAARQGYFVARREVVVRLARVVAVAPLAGIVVP